MKHEKTMCNNNLYLGLWLWNHLPRPALAFGVDDLVDVNQAASDDVIRRTAVQSKSQVCIEGWKEVAKHKKGSYTSM